MADPVEPPVRYAPMHRRVRGALRIPLRRCTCGNCWPCPDRLTYSPELDPVPDAPAGSPHPFATPALPEGRPRDGGLSPRGMYGAVNGKGYR